MTGSAEPTLYETLTRAERLLIPLIHRNLSNKEIAAELHIAEQTVKNEIYRLSKKLKAPTRMAIVRLSGWQEPVST